MVVTLSQIEDAEGTEGPVLLPAEPVEIVMSEPENVGMSGPMARKLAAALLNAADEWDRIYEPAEALGQRDAHRPPTRRPFWQTEPCPAWCDFQNGHDDRDAVADRTHTGDERRIELLVEEPQVVDVLDADLSETWGAQFIALYLAQEQGEVEPRVHIGANGGRGHHMRLAEAEQLRDALSELLEVARGVGRR